jgi:hypothetical protein
VLVQVALLAGLLTACSESADQDDDTAAKPSTSASGRSSSEEAGSTGDVAERGGTLGAPGSACELPVTFDTAKSWKAEAVEADPDDEPTEELAELADSLLHQGPFTMACEIDAKPAGHIGFIRIWTGATTSKDARTLLKEFVAAEDDTSKVKYTDFSPEDSEGSGAEVEYLYTSKALDETKKERAFAVTTPEGPVLVHLGGFDSDEHEEMLPAYALAKQTLRIA